MNNILFVNACPRGAESRTLSLAQAFLSTFKKISTIPTNIIEHDLDTFQLSPISATVLATKESLCNAAEWDNPLFKPAKDISEADYIVIAAPYWDLSFPAVLKIWVENIWVGNLTFHYENDKCIGHLKSKRVLYITTAGSPIGTDDWGAGYIKAVMKALGNDRFDVIRVEGLDLVQNDAQVLMKEGFALVDDMVDQWFKDEE